MAGKKLTRSVTVTNDETGETETFQAGDTLPAWASKLVTNPGAFEKDAEPADTVPGPSQSIFYEDAIVQNDSASAESDEPK